MPHPSLEGHRDAIAAAVAAHLCRRTASVFGVLGVEACQRFAQAGLDALNADLVAGNHDAIRQFAYPLVEELTGVSATYSDLRSLCQTLRKNTRAVVDEPTILAQVEAWFFELLLVLSVRYMAWRDEASQRESAKAGIARLESQLSELTAALGEKTRLLEVIRQASIPIVPVVSGILVVPLIGMFDSHRASLLTERLLMEITRTRARAALIDISGVPVFDTAAAQMIISLARSVRLVGSRIMLVGMSPDNARTIVDLGIDLDQLETFNNLQDGLAYALRVQDLVITQVVAKQTASLA